MQPILALTFINKVPSVGEDPCYVSLSPDGQNLFVANYSSGSLSAPAVQADGSLAGPVETLSHVGYGPNPERVGFCWSPIRTATTR
jgi:6-phosphogluconolactonase